MESKRLYTDTLKDRLAVFEYYERLVPSWIKTSLWLFPPTTPDEQSQFFKELQERLTKAMSILKGGSSVSIEMTKIFDQLAVKCKRFEAKIVTAENKFRDHYLVVFGYYKRLLPQWHETAVRLSLDEKKGGASADQQLQSLQDLHDQITEARFILKSTSVSSEQVVKIKELAESCEKLEALFTINAREDIERKRLTQQIQFSEFDICEALTEIRDVYLHGRRRDEIINLLSGLKLDTDRTGNKLNLSRQSQLYAALYEWAQNQDNPVILLKIEVIETWNISRRKAIEAMAKSYQIEIEATRNSIPQIKNNEALKEIFKARIKLLTLEVRKLGFSSGQGTVEKNDSFPTTTTPADDHKVTLTELRKELDNELKELRDKEIKLQDALDWRNNPIDKQLYALGAQIQRLQVKGVPRSSRRAADNELKELSNKEKELRKARNFQKKIINEQLSALANQIERLKKRISLVDLKIKREALELKLELKQEGYDGRLFSGTGEQGALQELTEQIKKIEKEIKLSRQSPMELAKVILEDEPNGDIETIPDSPFPEDEDQDDQEGENTPKMSRGPG